MASTSETAIVWTIILMLISGVSTLVNAAGPTGTTFFQIDNSFLQSLMLTPADVNTLVVSYQSPADKPADSIPVNTFVFINQALSTGAFAIKAAFNIAFTWAFMMTAAIFSVGIPDFFATLLWLATVAPLLILQFYGLLEIAFRMKRLIPFLG